MAISILANGNMITTTGKASISKKMEKGTKDKCRGEKKMDKASTIILMAGSIEEGG